MKFQFSQCLYFFPFLFGVNYAFWQSLDLQTDIDSLLTASAEAAFNRIELALEHINKLKSTTEGSYNKDVKELYDRLYWDEDLSDVATDLAGMLTVRKDITPWENKIYKYEDVPEDDVAVLSLMNIKEFWETRIDDGKGGITFEYAHRLSKTQVSKKTLDACFQSGTILAFTVVPESSGYAPFIQLCKDYISFLRANRVNHIRVYGKDRDAPTTNFAELSEANKEMLDDKRWVAADLFQDLAHVFVQQLSHTRLAGLAIDTLETFGWGLLDRRSHWLHATHMRYDKSAIGRAYLVTWVHMIIYKGVKPTKDGSVVQIPDWRSPN